MRCESIRLLLAIVVTSVSLQGIALTPQSGWYYNPSESGRGFNIEIQGTTLFIAGFLYDGAGHPIWFVSGGPMASDSAYSGAAYTADNGQPLGGTYRAPTSVPFGNVTITFPNISSANINVNGYLFSVTREIFGVVPAGSPEGLWVGATSTGETIIGIVLDTGTYYFLYTFPGTNTIAGAVQGSGIGSNGQLSSTNARDFNLGYGAVFSATVTGTYMARRSIAGQFSSALGSQSFTATYDARYETPASLSGGSGTYSATVASSAGFQSATFYVSSGGAISGSVPGCSWSGQATPHGNINAFDIYVRFSGGSCIFGTSTLYGIAYYDADTQTIYAAAPNAARTDGFLLVGKK